MLHAVDKGQCIISLPNQFIRDSIGNKYMTYLKKNGYDVFENATDFLESTIQSVEIGELSMGETEQVLKGGKKRRFKGSVSSLLMIQPRDATFTFRLIEGNLNWFMLHEEMLEFQRLGFPDTVISPIDISILSSNGIVISTITLMNGVFTSLSNLTINYQETKNIEKNFTMSMAISGIKIT